MSLKKPSENFSTVLYSNGIYQGFFQNKIRQGLGVYIWDSGEIYFGEWKNDNIEGEGYFFQPTGALIHSLFSNNKVHGPGILKLPDSTVILGYWNKGSLEGSSYKYFGKDDVWFLCEFVGKKFNQCLSRGKGFPEGMPQNEKAQNFKDLTDMGDIIENSNEKLKEKSSQFEFIYKNFDDGGVYLGLTKEKIPHGYGVFKFSDDKQHIGLYQNGILEGPCFIQFQNGDFYCGELKNGKFEGISMFFQKSKETWIHANYKSNVQQRIINKGGKLNNETREIIRANFSKTSDFSLKSFTPNNLYENPIFPAFEDMVDYHSKDWGLSPIKLKKQTSEKEKFPIGETERKINIYEIILNEKTPTVNTPIKSLNDETTEENAKANRLKTLESQNFLLDISQRELLEDPKELSFSKDIVHKEDIIFSNERNKKSVFSKQKSLAADINNTERKINNELLDENDKLHSRTKTEPNKETKEFQLGQALKTNKEILKKIKIEKNDNFSNNGEKKAIEDFKENINKIVKDVENTLKKVEEKKKNDEIKKMKKTDFKIKQEIENSEKKEQSPAETERKYLGVNIYPDILENPKRFLKENEGIMKKTKKYDDSNSKLNNSTQNHNPITTEINENVQIKETSKKEEYFEKNNDVNRNRMQSLNSDWSLGDNNYHSSFREYPNDTEKKQTVLIEDPEINRTEKKKLIGKNEEADFGSEIRLKTSEKCEKSNIVSKINNLKKEIDFRIGKLKENQKSRVYNRINYSNEEIDEYYDSLEKCYKDLGVGKGELLDLIIKRFKEELNRKFPQFANRQGFLFQKFNLPFNISNHSTSIPLLVRIPLN